MNGGLGGTGQLHHSIVTDFPSSPSQWSLSPQQPPCPRPPTAAAAAAWIRGRPVPTCLCELGQVPYNVVDLAHVKLC